MKIGTWLVSLIQPLLAKILTVIGFSVVSIVGFEAAIGQVRGLVVSNFAAAGSVIDFALYLWIGKGLGIVFGACTTKLALWQIQNGTRILGKGNG